MEGLQNNPAIAAPIKQQLTGEAKMIRAYWYFYLTNLYGDVPLVTKTDYKVNVNLSRTPRADVYTQMILDLKDAANQLSSNFVDATDTAGTTERARATKWAAKALLARMYLFNGDYMNAEALTGEVIANTALFSLGTDLNSVFLANSTEAIWQLATPLPNSINTADGRGFILLAAPSGGLPQGSTAISPQLMSSFEAGDLRKADWVGSFATTGVPATTYYFPYKYQVHDDNNNPNGRTEYNMVLRLAEQYLIRAEARAQQGNTAGALADLNVIRNRAGLAGYGGPTDNASLLAAILHERQVELFTEWGSRWFDLIRTKTVDAVMGAPGNVCQAKGGTWNANKALFPIPESEIQADSHLTQNAGY